MKKTIILRLLQNFSFVRATVENCMFRSPQGEKLHSRSKTHRVLQAAPLLFISGIALAVLGCNKDSDASLVIGNFTHDLKFTQKQIDYYLPLDVYENYKNTFRTFNQNTEYKIKILETLSAKYIRSAIHEVCSMYIRSEFLSIHVQFPSRGIYEKYLARFTKNPSVSRKDFAKMLKYEYSVYLSAAGKSIRTKNYMGIDKPVYKKQPYFFLDRTDRDYYLTSDFTNDMDVLSVWVRGKKWNDPNSTITRKDGRLFIHTIDSANELPEVNSPAP